MNGLNSFSSPSRLKFFQDHFCIKIYLQRMFELTGTDHKWKKGLKFTCRCFDNINSCQERWGLLSYFKLFELSFPNNRVSAVVKQMSAHYFYFFPRKFSVIAYRDGTTFASIKYGLISTTSLINKKPWLWNTCIWTNELYLWTWPLWLERNKTFALRCMLTSM